MVALCTSNLFDLPYIYFVKVALCTLFDMQFISYYINYYKWPCVQVIYLTCPTFIQLQQVLQTILDVLTPDDIRVLTECIDEDSRKGSFQRVFPTPSSHRYLRYMEAPRYYNLLVSQWVQRFNRMEQKGQGSNGTNQILGSTIVVILPNKGIIQSILIQWVQALL